MQRAILFQVFTGNSSTCMKISGFQVQKIMALVATHQETVPQLLDLLNAVVKVEELDLPLKRNQGFVMTYFMQFRGDVAKIIDKSQAERCKNNNEIFLIQLSYRMQSMLLVAIDQSLHCSCKTFAL